MKNKSMKTSALIMAAAMMMTAALSGCSNNSAPDNSTASTAASDANGSAAAGTSGETPADVQKIINAGKLKVGTKVDVPKFGLQNTGTGEYEGFEVDLAYTIAGKIFGCTKEEAKEKKLVEFQGVNAKTRGPLLDNGELDLVIATYTITPERKETWNFSPAYYTDAVGLLVKTDSGINSIEDLEGKIIGVSRGSTTKVGLLKYIEDNNINVKLDDSNFEEFDTYPELAAALNSKNIDVFSVDRAILAGYNDDTTTILEDRFAEQEYGVASAKQNTGLAALVDGVVTDLLDSGEMANMLKEWGIE